MTANCVFCGQPIGTEEEIAGRGAAIAHARCADAALADDAHWDAIAAAGGEQTETTGEEGAGAAKAGRRDADVQPRRAAGCLALALLAMGVTLLTAARRVARR